MLKSRSIPGERDWIESLRSHCKAFGRVKVGMGDDCAILDPPRGHEVLVTTDFSLENIHFRRDWQTPESVGHRCLARGLSDLAAMGAQPLAAFLSLALPIELVRSRRHLPSWRDRFFKGFLSLADKYQVPLAGGDTAQSPLNSMRTPRNSAAPTGWALADIVLIGSAPRGRALLRSGAKAGDRIYVTGQLGGAAAELAQLAAAPRRFRKVMTVATGDHPHLFPEPRLAVGAWLVKHRRANAAIDISDGLSTDLDHLCEESGVAATIDAAAIPMHPLAENLEQALHGGEDYELLFTASPAMHIPKQIAGVAVRCIGQMRRGGRSEPRVLLIDPAKGTRPLLPGGWEHYK